MQFTDVISRDRSFLNVPGSSKKRVLEKVSELIGDTIGSLETEEIFQGLISRERLGSTGLGDGVAIPHCRLENCQRTYGTIIKLPEPIDFDAIDRKPVDLMFVLLVPKEATEEHLQTLANVAELFGQESFRETLRDASSEDELYQITLNYNS